MFSATNRDASLDINTLHSKAHGGDRDAEDELFQSLTARFRLFAKREIWDEADSEDIVQSALVTIIEKYRGIEFEISFSAWAHRVLENKILSYYKKKGRKESVLIEGNDIERFSDSQNPDPEFEARLEDCLRKVSFANKRHARILILSYQGYTTREICSKLGITESNFYSLLSRSRSMLKFCLDTGDIK
jgi:RNA polymerase sigma factor (sigma-70 family)